jgi:predicted aconitase with swiveling domain
MDIFLIQTHVLIGGEAEGKVLVLPEPLSFWGGLDPQTGDIIDQRHPSLGQNVTGCMLVLPIGRGSSSASSILLEAVRVKKAPAAIITAEPDAILALGAAVARELYANSPPVVVLPKPDYNLMESGMWITLSENGILKIGD